MHAAILVTHVETEAVAGHFNRLKAETRGLLDVFLCVHEPVTRRSIDALRVDFRTWPREDITSLRHRYAEKESRGGAVVPGFADLVSMPVLLNQLSTYDYVWVLEYDLDFAGEWRVFFKPLMDRSVDFMGTTCYPRAQCPDWMWWPFLKTPAEVTPADHVRSFGPIVRLSRRMIDCYAAAIQTGHWRGHAEALYATIACYNGLAIEDLGGHGPFTPPSLRGRNYINNPRDDRLMPGTLTTRPPTQRVYFHVAPETFPLQGYLYHPVKASDVSDVSLDGWRNDPPS